MGHQAIVYGRIQEDWEGSQTRWPMAPEYNRAVLESLPDSDDHWPFLTRHLFAVAPRSVAGPAQRGFYRGSIVHFGASTKDDPADPDWPERFLAKFETAVLSQLLWRTAKVHFETAFGPERIVLYQVDPDSLGDLYLELRDLRFGEAHVSEVRWTRREIPHGGERPNWLY